MPRINLTTLLLLACFGTLPLAAGAFEIEAKQAAKVEFIGAVIVVTLPSGTYSISELPPVAVQLVFQEELPPKLRAKSPTVTAGEPIPDDEVAAVLEAWYRETAIDFASLKLRGLTVGRPQYATWCGNPSLFGCLLQEIRAGVLVTFSVNGANRQGGMSGFQDKVVMIRRSPK